MQVESYGFLGCDVSKGMCNFVLEKGNGEELESNLQLDDNIEGHQTLDALIKIWKEKHELQKIVVGLESTGGYENNWYKNLRNKSKLLGLEVFRINPKRIYHEGKTEGRRSITDGVSSQIIAGYLRKNYGKKDLESKRVAVEDEKQEQTEGLKTLYRYIKKLTDENSRKKNVLEKLLYSSMPEIMAVKAEEYANWFLELLIKYPSIKAMQSAGIEGLTSINYLTSKKAEQILSTIKESVGLSVDANISIAIREYAEDIQHQTKKINRLKKEIAESAKVDKFREEDIDIINSIKGMSDYSTLGVVLEIGSVSQYESAGSLVAYFGLNPTLKQSGDKAYKVGMSKDGSPYARATLFTAAENVKNYEPYFAAIYEKQIIAGKKHKSAIGVVMSKLTRIIYGMLKTRTKFDAGVDIYNQTKKPEVKPNTDVQKVNKERRYQKESTSAPISSRQKKKRKQEQTVLS
jgi:transposase